MQGEVAATCTGVVKIYETATGEVHALKGIDATFWDKSVTAVVGPSGSGKSSLLRIMAGLDRPTAGSVMIGDTELARMSPAGLRRIRRRLVGYVFQRPSDNLIPYLTVREHLEAAARLRGLAAANTEALLDRLGIGHRADHYPHQISGGEQQRTAFAQAVIGAPTLVVADEPTAELDSHSANALLEIVSGLAWEGFSSFVIATHDPTVVADADRTLSLRHGAMEAETHEARALSIIDDAGRIQLPPEALRLFPGRRALITQEDDEVRITPP